MNFERLMAEIERDEGRKLKPYRDSEGYLSIGIGRNLDAVGLSNVEVEFLFANDIERVLEGLDGVVPWWRNLNEERQRVLVNMAFNVGIEGYTPKGKLLTFEHTLPAMERGDWEAAARGMLASKWARQVGLRAERLAERMRTGQGPGKERT